MTTIKSLFVAALISAVSVASFAQAPAPAKEAAPAAATAPADAAAKPAAPMKKHDVKKVKKHVAAKKMDAPAAAPAAK